MHDGCRSQVDSDVGSSSLSQSLSTQDSRYGGRLQYSSINLAS